MNQHITVLVTFYGSYWHNKQQRLTKTSVKGRYLYLLRMLLTDAYVGQPQVLIAAVADLDARSSCLQLFTALVNKSLQTFKEIKQTQPSLLLDGP